jgi:hypothetical protein
METLKVIFDTHYVTHGILYKKYRVKINLLKSKEIYLQNAPHGSVTNPHLEITAHKEFSEDLKLHNFNYYMFEQLAAEGLHPDIMGYVIRNAQKKSKPIEVITVEVKGEDLSLRDLMQAKLYETFFNSKHTFLLSPTGMSGEKIEVALKYEHVFRGNIIIGMCGDDGKDLRINPRLTNKIPKEFANLCRL